MASHGDDCYFFYYSSCSKGDACKFRHCEEALGSETVCSRWEKGQCFQDPCHFRHMDIQVDRSTIACYWENQPGGCRKAHCVFKHFKSRDEMQGSTMQELSAPPTKLFAKTKVIPRESTVKAVTNRPLRRVSSDLAELPLPVDTPSPQVEPVVVNFEDESDQESPITTPVKQVSQPLEECRLPSRPKVVSLRRQDSQTEDDDERTLEWGVKSLDDIHTEKLNKAKKLLVEADSVLSQSLARHSSSEFGRRKTVSVTKPGIERRIIQTSDSLDSDPEEMPFTMASKRDIVSRLGSESNVTETRTVRTGVLSRLGGQQSATSDHRPGIAERLGFSKTVVNPKVATARGILGRLGRQVQETSKAKEQEREQDNNQKLSRVMKVKTFEELKREKLSSRLGVRRTESTQENIAFIVKRPVQGSPSKVVREIVASEDDIPVKSLEQIRREKAARRGYTEQETPSTQPDSTQPGRAQSRLAPKRTIREERKVYIPPAAKNSGSARSAPVEKAARVSPNKKKTSGWGVKTYSEIMREKQLKREQIASSVKSNPEEVKKRPMSPVVFGAENTNIRSTIPAKRTKRNFSPISFTVQQNVKEQTAAEKKPKKTFVPVVFDLDDDNESSTTAGKVQAAHSISPVVFDLPESQDLESKPAALGKKQILSANSVSGRTVAEPFSKRKTSVSSRNLGITISTTVEPTAGLNISSGITRSVTSPGERILSPRLRAPQATVKVTSPTLGSPTSQEVAIAKAVQQRTVSSTSDNGEEIVAPTTVLGRRLSVRRSTSHDSHPVGTVPPISSSTRVSIGEEDNTSDSFLDNELDDLLGDISALPESATRDSLQDDAEDDALLLEMEELLS